MMLGWPPGWAARCSANSRTTPSLEKIASHYERGRVANDAWGRYNVVNTVGMGAAAVGWAAARLTETRSGRLSETEQRLARTKDGLMAVALLTGITSGVAGAGLARQMPDGAVPVETGTEPAVETPDSAARLQRVIGVASTLNIVSGVALVAVNGVFGSDQLQPPVRTTGAHSSLNFELRKPSMGQRCACDYRCCH